ncbi:sterol desaturase family protein [Sandaracinus amylolyticus]|uniref:sterol desaturase family protein n=1 Tax=Sandaracinus amylolyticus TaxID=927083 RepID=UPI001F1D802E|nr:sterol desaturase family protein [Sandaracinus amylolyticus]UJR79301.1 Fatty acid hydroxylase [Sandaracinus amylolyticus]
MGLLDLTQECLDAAEGKLPEPTPGPNGKRGKPPQRIQVFKNESLEKWFAQAHPITPGIWFGPFVVWGLWSGAMAFGLGVIPLFAAGFLITTFIEYCLHRWIFHFVPKNEKQRLQHFLLHGYHHEFMNDPMRLVLPPIGIWPFAAIVAGIWYLVFGAYWFPIFAGTAAGYIAYDWVHYYTHYFNPKGGVGRWLKRYHMLHHHDSPNHRYGITSPLWDFVFGTYLPLNKMARQAGRHAAPTAEG